eukprot:Pgem_evm2s1
MEGFLQILSHAGMRQGRWVRIFKNSRPPINGLFPALEIQGKKVDFFGMASVPGPKELEEWQPSLGKRNRQVNFLLAGSIISLQRVQILLAAILLLPSIGGKPSDVILESWEPCLGPVLPISRIPLDQLAEYFARFYDLNPDECREGRILGLSFFPVEHDPLVSLSATRHRKITFFNGVGLNSEVSKPSKGNELGSAYVKEPFTYKLKLYNTLMVQKFLKVLCTPATSKRVRKNKGPEKEASVTVITLILHVRNLGSTPRPLSLEPHSLRGPVVGHSFCVTSRKAWRQHLKQTRKNLRSGQGLSSSSNSLLNKKRLPLLSHAFRLVNSLGENQGLIKIGNRNDLMARGKIRILDLSAFPLDPSILTQWILTSICLDRTRSSTGFQPDSGGALTKGILDVNLKINKFTALRREGIKPLKKPSVQFLRMPSAMPAMPRLRQGQKGMQKGLGLERKHRPSAKKNALPFLIKKSRGQGILWLLKNPTRRGFALPQILDPKNPKDSDRLKKFTGFPTSNYSGNPGGWSQLTSTFTGQGNVNLIVKRKKPAFSRGGLGSPLEFPQPKPKARTPLKKNIPELRSQLKINWWIQLGKSLGAAYKYRIGPRIRGGWPLFRGAAFM